MKSVQAVNHYLSFPDPTTKFIARKHYSGVQLLEVLERLRRPGRTSASSVENEGDHQTYLGHPTIDHEFSCVNEAALVAGKKEYCLSLFNSLTESSRWEMNLTTVALCCVIAKPILKKRSAEVEVSKLGSGTVYCQSEEHRGIELTSMELGTER